MATIFLLLILVASGLTGIRIVHLQIGSASTSISLLLSLGLGVGVGLTSVTLFYWWLVVGSLNGYFTFALLTAFAVAITAIVDHRLSDFRPRIGRIWNLRRPIPLFAICAIAFAFTLIVGASVFYATVLNAPTGGWDAIAIWNLRANFLSRAGSYWSDAFAVYPSSHTDYPILLPSFIAVLWDATGKASWKIPPFVAGLFFLATIALLVSAVSQIRSSLHGMLAGTVMLTSVFFSTHSASQYADLPLAYFFLATASLIALADIDEGNDRAKSGGYLFLAGLMAGFAAWTKNEGAQFIIVVSVARLITVLARERTLVSCKQLSPFIAGALPAVLVLAYFKLKFAPMNDLVAGQNTHDFFAKITSWDRYKLILIAVWHQLEYIGDGLLGVCLIAWLLARFSGRTAAVKRLSSTPDLVLLMMCCGYFLVLLVTPVDLAWQLSTALERLVFQLWPTAVFCFFLHIGELTIPRRGDYTTADQSLLADNSQTTLETV